MDREDLISRIENLIRICSTKGASEEDVSLAMSTVEDAAPHSEFSDIYAYNEKDRSVEEMVDEVLLRQRLFAQGGAEAVDAHIISLMKAALDSKPEVLSHLYSAYQILDSKNPQAAKEYEHLIWPNGR